MVQSKCYHQSTQYYTEFENEETVEIMEEDYVVCIECKMVIFQGKEMGLITD